MTRPYYTMGFLAWFRLVGFFPADALRDMLALGIDPLVADALITSEAFRSTDVVRWWQDYGRDNDSYGEAIEKYMQHHQDSYLRVAK